MTYILCPLWVCALIAAEIFLPIWFMPICLAPAELLFPCSTYETPVPSWPVPGLPGFITRLGGRETFLLERLLAGRGEGGHPSGEMAPQCLTLQQPDTWGALGEWHAFRSCKNQDFCKNQVFLWKREHRVWICVVQRWAARLLPAPRGGQWKDIGI